MTSPSRATGRECRGSNCFSRISAAQARMGVLGLAPQRRLTAPLAAAAAAAGAAAARALTVVASVAVAVAAAVAVWRVRVR